MSANTTMDKPVHSLVLDTGPIIKNDPPISTLLLKSQSLYTIPSVIEEIRDATTRTRVETTLLPFLTIRSPKPASVKFIQDFARKTGDLEVLSRPDIHLMALTYELECERNGGDWRLRNTPGQKRINGAPPGKDSEGKEEQVVEVEEKKEDGPVEEPEPVKARPGAWISLEDRPPAFVETMDDKLSVTEWPCLAVKEVISQASTTPNEAVEPVTDLLAETHISVTEVVSQASTQPKEAIEPITDLLAETHISEADSPKPETNEESEEPSDPGMTEEFESEDESDEDGGGWITPSNLHKHIAKDSGISTSQNSKSKTPQTLQVALLTSDYAMQNVTLRIGLNLLSPTLSRITVLKTWLLRCHACFSTTKAMEKQFCPKCGQPTLMRTSCQINGDTGEVKLFLKRNMQWSHRGDKFSIPKPTAGSTNGRRSEGGGKGGWGRELMLAEDQKEYVGALVERKRGEKGQRGLMDEDYLPSILSGERRGGGNGRIKVGAGRNVNSRRRN